MVMVTVSDDNRNLNGNWYGSGKSTCSAWLSYKGCTEEEKEKGWDGARIVQQRKKELKRKKLLCRQHIHNPHVR